MVAKIGYSRYFSSALRYNELKVEEGKAVCIFSSGFIRDTDQLTYDHKMQWFNRRNALNQTVRKKTLHLSLNFSPADQIDTARLCLISQRYMEKIGYINQPYLVYRHDDAAHPHVHILSSNIRSDGRRIGLNLLRGHPAGRARLEIEQEFGLIPAVKSSLESSREVQAAYAQKARYGIRTTRTSIENVLKIVMNQYQYSSLTAFQAILRLYNVSCNTVRKKSLEFRGTGLMYSILDDNGKKKGVPLPASRLSTHCTFFYLEKQFKLNEDSRRPFKKSLRVSIGWILGKAPSGTAAFQQALESEKISTVIWKTKEHVAYGITYIDHRSKCIFHGSELGRPFNIKSVLQLTGFKRAKRAGIREAGDQSLAPAQRVATLPNLQPSTRLMASPPPDGLESHARQEPPGLSGKIKAGAGHYFIKPAL